MSFQTILIPLIIKVINLYFYFYQKVTMVLVVTPHNVERRVAGPSIEGKTCWIAP